MVKLKTTALVVLALVGSAATAGTMGPICTPGSVTVPCEKTAWDFGVQALYLEAISSGQYAYYATNTTGVAPTVTNYLDVAPSWGWGFKLEGSYHFSSGNDLDLNWYHYNKNTNNNIAGTGVAFLIASPFGPSDAGSASYDPRWDAVNLEFGQHVDFGDFQDIRFHEGVQYARVRNNLNVAAASVTVPANTVYETNSATFNGFGPRFGADMAYNFGNGLAFYGNTAAALLIGTGKFSTQNATVTAGVSTLTNTYGSTTQFVPELEGKLGATYTYAMAQGDLSLDLGWMWVEYFSAQQNVITYTNAEGNLALTGPYVGLKWVGNV